jgi:hypothetical protein
MEIGAAIRSIIISKIKNLAFLKNVDIDIDEDKGLLESTYRIGLSGEKEDVLVTHDEIKKYVDSVASS